MILGHDIAMEKGLIENLCERELDNPEGCGFDVRIGKIYKMKKDGGEGFLHIDKRKSHDYEFIAEFKEGESKKIKIEPGEIYVAETIEIINTPKGIFGRCYPRGNLFISGILVLGQKTDPGYKGTFSFVIINLSGKKFELELGSRIAQFVFHEVKGKTSDYRGQWQGGRAFIKEVEEQV